MFPWSGFTHLTFLKVRRIPAVLGSGTGTPTDPQSFLGWYRRNPLPPCLERIWGIPSGCRWDAGSERSHPSAISRHAGAPSRRHDASTPQALERMCLKMEIAAKDVDYRCYRGDAINKRLSRRSPLRIIGLRRTTSEIWCCRDGG